MIKHGKKLVVATVAIGWSAIQVFNAATFYLDIFQIQVIHGH